MQKPPPVYESDLVLHPEHETSYTPFENAAAHPFQPDPPGGVPRVNAWWLADAALASYWEPAGAAAIFESAGLQSEYLVAGSTDAYVVSQDGWLAVVFRGTEPDQWEDVLTDVEMALVSWTTGRVHRGFKNALDEIWPLVADALNRLAPGRSVWFSGHSLGAALATLAADRYGVGRGVCTFGSPRVGDRTFATAVTAAFADRMLRFVNNNDVVTHVPLPVQGYKHIDRRRFIARDGTITGGVPTVEHFFADLIGEPGQLGTLIGDLEAHAGFTPAFLLDHMPKAYAIWAWNDYDLNG